MDHPPDDLRQSALPITFYGSAQRRPHCCLPSTPLARTRRLRLAGNRGRMAPLVDTAFRRKNDSARSSFGVGRGTTAIESEPEVEK